MLHAAYFLSMSLAGVDAGLVGHWKLFEDCADSSGNGNNGDSLGVVFREGAAVFDGRGAHMTVPHSDALSLGAGGFSVALWVHTENDFDDTIGDLVSKYDTATRHGFTLGIQNFSGVTSAQPNYRHLQFGIDAGRDPGGWKDCGRPGDSVFVMALAVYEGHLYAGVCKPGADAASPAISSPPCRIKLLI